MVESDDEEPEPIPLMSLKEKAAAEKKAKKAPNSSAASGAKPSSQRPGATSSVPTRPISSDGAPLSRAKAVGSPARAATRRDD